MVDDAIAKNRLFYASVCEAPRGGGRRGRHMAPAWPAAGSGSAARGAQKKSARVLTVKKTVIRFRPADAACRSE
ncbi:hypothetical protein [Pseudoxanthomonas broegbernensis]|uniref:hypothetical protein n=1 Tax=Pseudoxanthomonas broegbernensis TaxID=83619 RepID=UPI00139201CD|nr:hypothetical protein [Pseudoxanthomonas broegbernensis]MBB6063796.1 hypothetical protein [Pseudoxanthomonas broegbernensis]